MTDSIRRWTPRCALVAAAAACVAAAGSGTSSARFEVGATVRAVAAVERESDPPGLRISAADLRRGYVDAAAPVDLLVRSNSPSGFAVDVTPLAPIATAIEIRGFAAAVSLGADGGSVVERWRRPQERRLSLRLRFMLAPGVAAGDYPWPVRLSVRPLAAI